MKIGIKKADDIRLKQAIACAEKHGCENCPDFKECQELDDRHVAKAFNHMFSGKK